MQQRVLYMHQRSYGGLKDEDRIFTNLYGRHDWKLKGSMSRVSCCSFECGSHEGNKFMDHSAVAFSWLYHLQGVNESAGGGVPPPTKGGSI